MLWRALLYLLFTVARDRELNLRLIGMDALEWIAGERIYHSSTRRDAFRTGAAVIEKIRTELLPDLRVNEAEVAFGDPVDGVQNRRGKAQKPKKEARCRTVDFDGIAAHVYRQVRDDLSKPVADLETRVRLLDGSRYNEKAVRAGRDRDWKEAVALHAGASSETARYFLERMNDAAARPRNGYTKLLAHMDRAKALALELEVDRKPRSTDAEYRQHVQEVRDGALRLLRAIEDQPQPYYQPSTRGRTDRIFPLNPSILLLPSSIRRVLTEGAGWVDLDLASAHLAIAAWLWDVEPVRDFLAGGGSAWTEILNALGLGHLAPTDPLYADVKDAVKVGTYSAVYGMAAPSIKGAFTKAMKALNLELRGRDFAECWIIRELVAAREAQIDRIHLEGGIETPTGIRAALDASAGVDAKSVLATVAQSYEAMLMKPILEYEAEHLEATAAASEKPDFRLMLWQHDGCSVRFWRRQKSHTEEMQRRVQEVADTFRIPIRLDTK